MPHVPREKRRDRKEVVAMIDWDSDSWGGTVHLAANGSWGATSTAKTRAEAATKQSRIVKPTKTRPVVEIDTRTPSGRVLPY